MTVVQESRDVRPNKVLRPIGTRFKETIDTTSTDPPHEVEWEIVAHIEAARGQQYDIMLFERMEEIRSVESEVVDG